MPRIIVLAALSLASAGCVFIDADVAPHRTFQPVPLESVEVLTTDFPETDFDEVGLIEVSGNDRAKYPALLRRAQQEAAALGADAILVSRRPVRSAAALADPDSLDAGTAVGHVTEADPRRIWAVAIRWKGVRVGPPAVLRF